MREIIFDAETQDYVLVKTFKNGNCEEIARSANKDMMEVLNSALEMVETPYWAE